MKEQGVAFCCALTISIILPKMSELHVNQQEGYGTFYVSFKTLCSKYLVWLVREGHHQFLNYYGLPEARLMRSHSVEANRQRRALPILLATAAMFGVPVLVLEHIASLHVDGIVNLLDIDKFVDRFNNDNLQHSTLVCESVTHNKMLPDLTLLFRRQALSWLWMLAYLPFRILVLKRRQ